MERTSLVDVTIDSFIAERVELLLRLTHERIKPCLHVR
jgi:hypothetical protein